MNYPNIDPVAISLGPIAIHWYGVMYLVAFVVGGVLGLYRAKRSDGHWTGSMVWDLVFYVAVGAVLGGRLGYVVFYNATFYLANPVEIFSVWTGGMSFHGGLIGVIVAVALFAKRVNVSFFAVADFLAPLCAPGLMAGRIGNFINQELWGRPADVPWAMVFPYDPSGLARHPSQLYQFAMEGLLLFFILYWYTRTPRPRWSSAGLFLLGYGVFRSIAEFFREPDAHIGFDALGWLTRGQLLSLPMIVAGLAIIIWAYRRDART